MSINVFVSASRRLGFTPFPPMHNNPCHFLSCRARSGFHDTELAAVMLQERRMASWHGLSSAPPCLASPVVLLGLARPPTSSTHSSGEIVAQGPPTSQQVRWASLQATSTSEGALCCPKQRQYQRGGGWRCHAADIAPAACSIIACSFCSFVKLLLICCHYGKRDVCRSQKSCRVSQNAAPKRWPRH